MASTGARTSEAGLTATTVPGAGGRAPREARDHVPGSATYMDRARRVIPRGMASRGRARAVPVVFRDAAGSRLWDVDGNEYVDTVMALGPLLLGHSPRDVLDAVAAQLQRGILYGGQFTGEAELAERIVDVVPSAEKVLFSNTGSEAVAAALRIARASTGRQKIIKFEGHYHGWLDPMFVNSPGVPSQPVQRGQVTPVHNVPGQQPSADVLVLPWNDEVALELALKEHSGTIAAVIMEPLAFNLGTFAPSEGYLLRVRDLCTSHGTLLVFDEVVAGFRVGLGGAQALLGVTPDITVMAKALASGFSLAAIAGTDEALWSCTTGPVYHGGTYNGSPACVAAGIATVDRLRGESPGVYAQLDSLGRRLADGVRAQARAHDLPIVVNQIGSVIQLFWHQKGVVSDYRTAAAADPAPIAELCERILAEGVYATPRGLLFLSTAHSEDDVDRIVGAFDTAMAALADSRT